MKHLFTLLLFSFCSIGVFAQFGTATDFTFKDIKDVEHNLFTYLEQDKVVIIDVSTTWCPPCWSLHQSHALNKIYEKYGPDGTDQVRVLFYEGDATTTLADLQGSGSNTLGDWLTGVLYPVANESPLSLDLNKYAPEGFPTVYVIKPDKSIVADMWNYSYDQMEDVMDEVLDTPSSTHAILANDIKISPNPSSGPFEIVHKGLQGQIRLYNTIGQLVLEQKINGDATNFSNILKQGTYQVQIITESKETFTSSLVIQ